MKKGKRRGTQKRRERTCRAAEGFFIGILIGQPIISYAAKHKFITFKLAVKTNQLPERGPLRAFPGRDRKVRCRENIRSNILSRVETTHKNPMELSNTIPSLLTIDIAHSRGCLLAGKFISFLRHERGIRALGYLLPRVQKRQREKIYSTRNHFF